MTGFIQSKKEKITRETKMNQRIKELAEQAGIEFDDSFSSEPETIYYLKLSDFEKFARLILEECFQRLAAEAERLYALQNDDADLCAEKCYDNIQHLKEHFGVEK